MTETQERFIRSVLTRVPFDTVVEMHLFPPIRRGTLETGVAVIATRVPPAPLTMIDLEVEEVVAVEDGALTEVALDGVDTADRPVHDPLADAVTVTARITTLEEGDEVGEIFTGAVHDNGDLEPVDGHINDVALAEVPASAADVDPSAVAGSDVSSDDGTSDDVTRERVTSDDLVLIEEIEAEFETVPLPTPRMRILTASYRHTIKGVERGKWSVDVQVEADAPLEAVELVLRGVRHRSTEPADPELVSHDALAALWTRVAVAPAA